MSGLSVDEDDSAAINNSALLFTDDIQPASALRYTVTSGTTNGLLAYATNPTQPITSFTQLDIDSGFVVYQHDGSETLSDQFTFTVDDGQGNATTPQVFNITIAPTNDDPQIDGGPAFAITENAAVGTIVGTMTVSDNDLIDTHAFNIVGGTGQSVFSIDKLRSNHCRRFRCVGLRDNCVVHSGYRSP